VLLLLLLPDILSLPLMLLLLLLGLWLIMLNSTCRCMPACTGPRLRCDVNHKMAPRRVLAGTTSQVLCRRFPLTTAMVLQQHIWRSTVARTNM
jgi:hypothetical protein